jgi:SAM-dependent methyltransferase
VTGTTVRLTRDDVEFHPLSYFDEGCRLFRWQGGLYRVVHPAREAFYRDALASGLVARLVERRLIVETTASALTLDGNLVLEHRTLPLVAYPWEWSPEMLRDAALVTLALERELEREGLMLQDAHPVNVVFDGSRPVWIDVGSFVPLPADGTWPAEHEFVGYFLNPLRLTALGQGRVARWLLHDNTTGIRASELEPFLPDAGRRHAREAARQAQRAVRARVPGALRRWLRPARERFAGRRDGEAALAALEQQIRALDLAPAAGFWTDYYGTDPAAAAGEAPRKHAALQEALRRVAPATVLDVGANRGVYSLSAARAGSAVAALDTDERSIADLYRQARAEKLPVQALLADFLQLSMGYGPGYATMQPAPERLGADLVLALALTHHLVFTAHLDFAQIVAALSAFAKQALLVEFVPPDDRYVAEWQPERRPWYTLDVFVDELRKEFPHVEQLPSDPEPRVLLLCVR